MKLDLSGHVLGRLTVVSRAPNVGDKTRWECLCACGVSTVVYTGQLRSGKTKSCGCLSRELSGQRSKHGHARDKRENRHPLYVKWGTMRSRCNNPNDPNYKYYGGRGIKICERWNDFTNFIADVGMCPSPRHSIDRIDNDGDYEPSNCRWATKTEQNRNRRVVKINLETARAILARFRSGEPRLAIAAAYGVSRSVVAQIGCGRNWPEAGTGHLPKAPQ